MAKGDAKKNYIPVICVTSGDGYKKGTIYPMMGYNNGVHILRENEESDVDDNIFCSGGIGAGTFNNFNDTGHPSFDLIDETTLKDKNEELNRITLEIRKKETLLKQLNESLDEARGNFESFREYYERVSKLYNKMKL